MNLPDIFKQLQSEPTITTKNKIADLLKTTPEALEAFENAYKLASLNDESIRDQKLEMSSTCSEELVSRIVNELLLLTEYVDYDGKSLRYGNFKNIINNNEPVTLEELMSIHESIRPQLSGRFVKKDFDVSSMEMLYPMWDKHINGEDERIRELGYHMFRQGLDILDIDPILYEMLGVNSNSLSKWFVPLVNGVHNAGSWLKIPKTRTVKVPMPVLQMSRIEYQSLTPSTLKIIDDWAFNAFNLETSGDYFIKTGVHSSKFDFRNARVTTEKEVRELGEYLLYIQYNATCMAGSLHVPVIYGVSTTNEWVVREFIKDKENNPTIYKGMPLHTEYRFFVDFDTGEVLGVAPYWEPDLLKKRFSEEVDADSLHMKHDYIIYRMHEETLMKRFYENRSRLAFEVEKLLGFCDLKGQWSLDVMQNDDDFWLIDMATASSSALREYIPPNTLKIAEENWLAINIGESNESE